MVEASRPNVKSLLIRLKSDTIPDFASKQHLSAIHEIIHHIFQGSFQRLWINQVKVNLFVSCNLNPLVSFDEIDKAAKINSLIVHK